MSTNRVYVPFRITAGEALWLEAERAHYLSRVLRVRVGDRIVIFDGHAGQYAASVGKIERQRVQLLPLDYAAVELESCLDIRLIQGISRGDRMDFVVQKVTELGVRRISPARTEFSVVHLDSNRAQKKADHWSRISQSACEQCGRNTLPIIDVPSQLGSLLETTPGGTRIALLPGTEMQISDLQNIDNGVTLLIGPEGGLSDAEQRLAIEHGFVPMSLGPRILRTETAAVAAVAILQSRFGDLRQISA
jgi:16S rRNA (uracil1498-N3)-methyltransferase